MAEDPRSSTPGERRLDRPPSERYPAVVAEDRVEAGGSPTRGLAWGALAALVGAIAITLAGGLITITAGLLVLAAVVGWATAVAVLGGAGRTIAAGRRAALSAVLALAGVGLGQLGLWLLGRQEGGVLPLLDYLDETFGILVPLELAVAAVVAWVRAR